MQAIFTSLNFASLFSLFIFIDPEPEHLPASESECPVCQEVPASDVVSCRKCRQFYCKEHRLDKCPTCRASPFLVRHKFSLATSLLVFTDYIVGDTDSQTH